MKSLSTQNYFVRPFKTFKTHLYSFTYLSTQNTNEITVNEATVPSSTWIWAGPNEPVNPNGIYKSTLYKSIQKLFYPTPTQLFDNITYTGTGSQRDPAMFDRQVSFASDSSFYVLNISQATFGETVYPGSIVITSPSSTASLFDDGEGRLTSSTNSGSIIGNVFYSLGIAVIKKALDSQFQGSVVSHEGLFMNTGSIISAKYQSQHTIYEHNIICTLEKNELNFSTNPSMETAISGSNGNITRPLDLYATGSMPLYMTSLGFYNDSYELIAFAKFPRALRRAKEVDQTFVIRLDV